MADFSLQLMAKKSHLGVRAIRLPFGKLCSNTHLNFFSRQQGVLIVNFLELPDLILEGTAEEPAQGRFCADDGILW